MHNYILGIDLGTSSVKVIAIDINGNIFYSHRKYDDQSISQEMKPDVWLNSIYQAVRDVANEVGTGCITAIGLTSQTGTYVVLGENNAVLDVIEWSDGSGPEELESLLSEYSSDFFMEHITMEHPKLLSYPIPRFRWLVRKRPALMDKAKKLIQIKDYIYYRLTGIFASDRYTWRGLANIEGSSFHEEAVRCAGISLNLLPKLFDSYDAPGSLTSEATIKMYLDQGIPVYVGCNDFYAALLGSRIQKSCAGFDITGSSEHIGCIVSEAVKDSKMISSKYFDSYVNYGVTANTGAVISCGMKLFKGEISYQELLDITSDTSINPPIFLPYLKGERAPIWDTNARGVFFGISDDTDVKQMQYSIFEGIVFNLYQIWLETGAADVDKFVVSGGIAHNYVLNLMKASIFGISFIPVANKNSTALGAAMFASVGENWFNNITDCQNSWVIMDSKIDPDIKLGKYLQTRYTIFSRLYPALKSEFKIWGNT